MHVSYTFLQSLFTCRGSLAEAELEYLGAAEQGDLAGVQKAIHESNVNINCVDHMGRSALELALMNDQVSELHVHSFVLLQSSSQTNLCVAYEPSSMWLSMVR